MLKAFLLVFNSQATWEGIARARRGIVYVLTVHLLPLLVLTAAAEGYGLHHWGKWQGAVQRLKEFSTGEAIVFEAVQLVISLAVVFLGARLVKSLGETFHGRHTYLQAFTLVAYGLSPVFLLRLFDAFRGVSPWATWGVGIVLTFAVLYHGVPLVMEPDPPQAFGLYMVSSLSLLLISGLARFLTAWYLQGRFTKLEPILSGIAGYLPF